MGNGNVRQGGADLLHELRKIALVVILRHRLPGAGVLGNDELAHAVTAPPVQVYVVDPALSGPTLD